MMQKKITAKKGRTHREFSKGIYEHIGYVRNRRLDKITGDHFNSPGRSTNNMKFTILDKAREVNSPLIQKGERYAIHMNIYTFYTGLMK